MMPEVRAGPSAWMLPGVMVAYPQPLVINSCCQLGPVGGGGIRVVVRPVAGSRRWGATTKTKRSESTEFDHHGDWAGCIGRRGDARLNVHLNQGV